MTRPFPPHPTQTPPHPTPPPDFDEQQAVEQSYLSIAARPEQRTELTGLLSSFACLGFILGPTCGAIVSQLPEFRIGLVVFNSFTTQVTPSTL